MRHPAPVSLYSSQNQTPRVISMGFPRPARSPTSRGSLSQPSPQGAFGGSVPVTGLTLLHPSQMPPPASELPSPSCIHHSLLWVSAPFVALLTNACFLSPLSLHVLSSTKIWDTLLSLFLWAFSKDVTPRRSSSRGASKGSGTSILLVSSWPDSLRRYVQRHAFI